MKFRIAGFDANKKAVRRCVREAMHVENRMVRLGQPVQGEHSEYRGERRAEHRELKSDGNESGPAIERAAADVHGVAAHVGPNLEEESRQSAADPAEQRDRRHKVELQAERFGEPFDREWGISIQPPVAGFANFFGGMDELLRSFELTHHAVDMGALQMHYFSSSEVSATSSRISAMEIAGRKRTNRKIRVTNMPLVPMNVAQSQNVGL